MQQQQQWTLAGAGNQQSAVRECARGAQSQSEGQSPRAEEAAVLAVVLGVVADAAELAVLILRVLDHPGPGPRWCGRQRPRALAAAEGPEGALDLSAPRTL